jgi:hypothetical protein
VATVAPQAKKPLILARAPLPPAKPGTPANGFEELAQVLSSSAVAATPQSTSNMAPLYAVVPPVRLGRVAANSAAGAGTGITNSNGQIPTPVPRPTWAVQLGEFQDRAIAVARVTEVTLGNVETLASAAPVIDEIRGRQGDSLYRVRFVGLAPDDASQACRRLKADGRDCITLAPGT